MVVERVRSFRASWSRHADGAVKTILSQEDQDVEHGSPDPLSPLQVVPGEEPVPAASLPATTVAPARTVYTEGGEYSSGVEQAGSFLPYRKSTPGTSSESTVEGAVCVKHDMAQVFIFYTVHWMTVDWFRVFVFTPGAIDFSP